MTPKEKANELVDKIYEDDLLWEDLTYTQAKQCALIVVDEILTALTKEDNPQTLEYWQEVQYEIEKL